MWWIPQFIESVHVSSYLVLSGWVRLQVCLHKHSSWFLIDYFEVYRSIVISEKGVDQLAEWGALHGNNIDEYRGCTQRRSVNSLTVHTHIWSSCIYSTKELKQRSVSNRFTTPGYTRNSRAHTVYMWEWNHHQEYHTATIAGFLKCNNY